MRHIGKNRGRATPAASSNWRHNLEAFHLLPAANLSCSAGPPLYPPAPTENMAMPIGIRNQEHHHDAEHQETDL